MTWFSNLKLHILFTNFLDDYIRDSMIDLKSQSYCIYSYEDNLSFLSVFEAWILKNPFLFYVK